MGGEKEFTQSETLCDSRFRGTLAFGLYRVDHCSGLLTSLQNQAYLDAAVQVLIQISIQIQIMSVI